MVVPWNVKVIMMTTVSSLAVSEDAIMTAFCVTGGFEFIAQMLCFSVFANHKQWIVIILFPQYQMQLEYLVCKHSVYLWYWVV